MRKSKYEMMEEDAYRAFDESPYATLSCIKENGHPYAVVLSMVRKGTSLYFHCAMEGEKNNALNAHPQVCVASVKQYEYADLSTYYISVNIEGIAHIVQDENEKVEALRLITKRFVPSQMEHVDEEIKKCQKVTCVYKIDVTCITGKKKLKNT